MRGEIWGGGGPSDPPSTGRHPAAAVRGSAWAFRANSTNDCCSRTIRARTAGGVSRSIDQDGSSVRSGIVCCGVVVAPAPPTTHAAVAIAITEVSRTVIHPYIGARASRLEAEGSVAGRGPVCGHVAAALARPARAEAADRGARD